MTNKKKNIYLYKRTAKILTTMKWYMNVCDGKGWMNRLADRLPAKINFLHKFSWCVCLFWQTKDKVKENEKWQCHKNKYILHQNHDDK